MIVLILLNVVYMRITITDVNLCLNVMLMSNVLLIGAAIEILVLHPKALETVYKEFIPQIQKYLCDPPGWSNKKLLLKIFSANF